MLRAIALFLRSFTDCVQLANLYCYASLGYWRRVVFLKSTGYSVSQSKKRLQEENIIISSQALFNILKKFTDTGKLIDLPQRTRPRKLSREIMVFLNKEMMSLLQDKPAAYWLRIGPLCKYLYQQLNAFNNK